MTRSVVFWVRRPPYSTNHLTEAIRAHAMSSALGLAAQLLFSGDGVWALVGDQEGYPLGPPPATVLTGLVTRDSPAVVSASSMASRSIEPHRLAGAIPHRIAGDDEIAEMLSRADTVVAM